jgi:hypothetical protein
MVFFNLLPGLAETAVLASDLSSRSASLLRAKLD